MERTKQIKNFLMETDKKCPSKHFTLLRLYIIYKVRSVLSKRHRGKIGKRVCGYNTEKVSIKTLHFAPCIYNRYKARSVSPSKPEKQ